MKDNRLDSSFPDEITVHLHEGTYDGQRQLWAHYEHAGKSHKLVVTGNTSLVRKGEERTIYPFMSPNGHIVFCRLYPLPRRAVPVVWSNYPFDYDGEDLYCAKQERFWPDTEESGC